MGAFVKDNIEDVWNWIDVNVRPARHALQPQIVREVRIAFPPLRYVSFAAKPGRYLQ